MSQYTHEILKATAEIHFQENGQSKVLRIQKEI